MSKKGENSNRERKGPRISVQPIVKTPYLPFLCPGANEMAHGGDRAITRSIGAMVGVFATVFLAGCPGIQVTGRDPVTRSGSQAETALTTSFANNRFAVIAAYNDETGSEGTISYTPTTRVVSRGASLMGWSYSLDNGKTWAYGGK